MDHIPDTKTPGYRFPRTITELVQWWVRRQERRGRFIF